MICAPLPQNNTGATASADRLRRRTPPTAPPQTKYNRPFF